MNGLLWQYAALFQTGRSTRFDYSILVSLFAAINKREWNIISSGSAAQV